MIFDHINLEFSSRATLFGKKQLFEITYGEKLFFNGIAGFMGFSEIVESVFFGEDVKQVSNDKSRGYFESY